MNFQQVLTDLQSLDTQNPGAWPLYVRVAASLLAGLLILGGGAYYLVFPEYDNLARVEAEEQALRSEFQTKQQKVASLDAYKEQLQEMERSFGAMLKQLPSKTEVANLLNDISQTRVASSLEEELFQPQGEVPKDFYAEIPNKIVVLGTFHEMGTFASGVAALPRIVTVDDVEIKPSAPLRGGKDAPASGAVTLRMQALAKTYRYLDDAEIAEQEAKNKPAGAQAKRAGGGE